MESENRITTPWLDVVMELAIRYNHKKTEVESESEQMVWERKHKVCGQQDSVSYRENHQS